MTRLFKICFFVLITLFATTLVNAEQLYESNTIGVADKANDWLWISDTSATNALLKVHPDDLNVSRFTEAVTVRTFTASDSTPDITNGGTTISRVWTTVDTTSITDFDDGDDHSEFVSGDWFVLQVRHAGTIDFSSNANIEGNGGQDFVGSTVQLVDLFFKWDGTRWVCNNLIAPMSDPTTIAISSISVQGTITGYTKSISITSAEGAHDGAANASTLTDSGEAWPTDQYIGMTLYNVTDGSSCTVTDNDGTTMTGVLSGGTDNDWDVSDVWAVSPGPNQSGAIFYINAATTILHPSTAGYTACYYSDGANAVKIDPVSSSMVIVLDGTSLTAGNEIDSSITAGDYICLQNRSTTKANTLGRSGTWVDGGGS